MPLDSTSGRAIAAQRENHGNHCMALEYAQADRRTIIREIRRGKLTIEGAARKFGVPTSGIVGWMKIAKMKIPEEYSK
ncbi:MAG: hypothetical protein EKK29_01390, partial [Hyphomicrobiales bacterium]